MTQHRCDACGIVIKDDWTEGIYVRAGFLDRPVLLCFQCGKGILKVLKKFNLIKKSVVK